MTEAHPTTPSYWRGVNVSGAEFGAPFSAEPTSRFSNENPGRYDDVYHYDGQRTFTYLASYGVGLIRLQLSWERLQPRPGGALSTAELRRLEAALGRTRRAGLEVILDIHNFGDYYLHENGRGPLRARLPAAPDPRARRPLGAAEQHL